MAEIKRVTLHPLYDDGTINKNINIYPKTLVDGIVDREGNPVDLQALIISESARAEEAEQEISNNVFNLDRDLTSEINIRQHEDERLEAKIDSIDAYSKAEIDVLLLGKENTSNKKTIIDSNSTNVDYPSALAVKNYVDSHEGKIDHIEIGGVEVPIIDKTIDLPDYYTKIESDSNYVGLLGNQEIEGDKTFKNITTFDNVSIFNDNAIFEEDIYVKSGLIDETDKRIELKDISLANNLENGEGDGAIIQTNVPLSNIIWTSSDESVATVDNDGTVHAVAPGTAVITASEELTAESDECEVTVTGRVILKSPRNGNSSILYSLDTTSDTSVRTNKNSYADIGTYTDVSGITWYFQGNGQLNPWRIGGKSITNEPRQVYTSQIIGSVNKVSVSNGTISGTTISSLQFIVAEDAEFEDVIYSETVTENIANNIINFEPEDEPWTDLYYKLIYTITISATSNKYMQFNGITFYTQPIAVTGVELDINEAEITLGETLELTATVEPENAADKSVFWYSDDEDVATVDEDGVVTAIGLGTTTITVETEDGGFTAECEVTVVRPTGDPIFLNTNTLKLKVGGTSKLIAKYVTVNVADGELAIALGHANCASGRLSFLQGDHLYSETNNQVIFGSYNEETDSKFVIAAGNEEETFNAFEVTDEGKAVVGSSTNSNDSNRTLTTKDYVDANAKYPTQMSWNNGTNKGPTATITMSDGNNISVAAFPYAGTNISGVVTTGEQTFAGNKTFTGNINVNGTLTIGNTTITEQQLIKLIDLLEALEVEEAPDPENPDDPIK